MQADLNDFILVQSPEGLDSRSNINLEYNPIFVAPMDTVISKNNMGDFIENGINICLPRGQHSEPNDQIFTSFGIEGFEQLMEVDMYNYNGAKILIDVANGNMPRLHTAIKKFKTLWPNSIIMAGNVGSVFAFQALADTGCDYIRVGIGGGSGCLTSVHTRVGQGMGSLIMGCAALRLQHEEFHHVKIVADGGMQNYGDIIIALAMGADYVMLGGILNKAYESAGQKYVITKKGKYKPIDKYLARHNKSVEELIKDGRVFTDFRGMSTKAVQRLWGRKELKSSEGVVKMNKVEYTLEGWMENFLDYLKSAMSYTGSQSLASFRMSLVEQITDNVYRRFNK
jgi:IMP dehydrogenase/GMP reductase